MESQRDFKKLNFRMNCNLKFSSQTFPEKYKEKSSHTPVQLVIVQKSILKRTILHVGN